MQVGRPIERRLSVSPAFPDSSILKMWCFLMRILLAGFGSSESAVWRFGSGTWATFELGRSSGAICTFFPGWPLFGFTLFRARPFFLSLFGCLDDSPDLVVLFILDGGLSQSDEGALKMAQNKIKNCAKSSLAVGLILSEAHMITWLNIRHYNLCQNVDGWSTQVKNRYITEA